MSTSKGQSVSVRLPRHMPGELFLKGPIPFAWLATAARLPGHALHVGVLLWFEAGMKRTATVQLSSKRTSALGMSRWSVTRGLSALEGASLISVRSASGRRHVVTLLPVHQEVEA